MLQGRKGKAVTLALLQVWVAAPGCLPGNTTQVLKRVCVKGFYTSTVQLVGNSFPKNAIYKCRSSIISCACSAARSLCCPVVHALRRYQHDNCDGDRHDLAWLVSARFAPHSLFERKMPALGSEFGTLGHCFVFVLSL